jgi:hypothetical protein
VLEGLYFIIVKQVLECLCLMYIGTGVGVPVFCYIRTGVGGPVDFKFLFIMELESCFICFVKNSVCTCRRAMYCLDLFLFVDMEK